MSHPRVPIEPAMKGYGIRAVEGRTLAEMLEKCRSVQAAADAAEVERARCGQLLRTIKNQPGNSAPGLS